jgi:sporulation protein YlmC with PRC-barrel domain
MDKHGSGTHHGDIALDPGERRETTTLGSKPMIRTSEIETLLCTGGTVIDRLGEKVGDIQQIFLDDATGHAEWVTVAASRFGSEALIPLRDGVLYGTTIQVPYDRNKVKRAVLLTGWAGPPSPAEATRLYVFYGCADPSTADSGRAEPGRTEST